MVDSETRWRMVRRLKQKGPEPERQIEIRAATFQDLPQVTALYNYFIRNTVVTFDEKPFELIYWQEKLELLNKFDLPFLVAIKGGTEVLGYAFVAPWRQRSGYLKVVENSIYLMPAATGKKLGSRLLQELLIESKKAGVREVIAVIADRGAEASLALHKKLGFQEQGHLAKVGVRFGKPIGSYLLGLNLGK